MTQIVITIVTAVAVPAIALAGGARLMSRAARHHLVDELLQTAGAIKPLNQRWRGYTVDDVVELWNIIRRNRQAVQSERDYLRLDLLFPLLYVPALAASIYLLRDLSGHPWHPVLAYGPVLCMAVADWRENSEQIAQFDNFDGNVESLDPGAITRASWATSVKLISFCICLGWIIGLIGAVAYKAAA